MRKIAIKIQIINDKIYINLIQFLEVKAFRESNTNFRGQKS